MMTREQFERELPALLRERPRGTVSLLTDCLAAYWNRHGTAFAFLCERGSGAVDEEFDLDDYVWKEWQPALEAWLADPVFSARPEALRLLVDAPPFEAGT